MKKNVKNNGKHEPQLHIFTSESNIVENADQTHSHSRASTIFLMVLSVLLAFAIWVYAKSVDTTLFEEEISGVVVQLENIDSIPFSVISGYNTTVSVTVSGKRADLRSLKASDINAWADVGFVTTAGIYTVPIHVSLPGGLTQTSLSADSIRVYLDNTVTVTVPVEVEMTDWVLDNAYELGDATTNPASISVSGPETVLNTVSCAKASVALGHITNTMTLSGRLTLVDENGERISNPYVKMATENVDVTVPVYMVREVPLRVECKYGYLNDETAEFQITPSTIRIKGEASVIAAIESIPLSVIDETKVLSNTLTRQIELPEQVINVAGITTAQVTITHRGTTQRTFAVNNIRVENAGDRQYLLTERAINVTVRMSNAVMPYITAENIVLTVDMSTLSDETTGYVQIPATVSFENVYSYLLYAIGDYQVTVRVY